MSLFQEAKLQFFTVHKASVYGIYKKQCLQCMNESDATVGGVCQSI